MIIDVTSSKDPRLADYVSLKDVNLRKKIETDNGLYLAESIKVIKRALAHGHKPRSFLFAPKWLHKMDPIIKQYPETPAFILESNQIEALTGFNLHRGALAAMHRPDSESIDNLISSAQTLVVLDGLSDHTNVGAVFRSIAGLGGDGVLLSSNTADPLYRRAIRVSMGAVFNIPWAKFFDWKKLNSMLLENNFTVVGMDLASESVELTEFLPHRGAKLAIVLGSEGSGLSTSARKICKTTVKISMLNMVDSLNVAASAAVMLWSLRTQLEEGE